MMMRWEYYRISYVTVKYFWSLFVREMGGGKKYVCQLNVPGAVFICTCEGARLAQKLQGTFRSVCLGQLSP